MKTAKILCIVLLAATAMVPAYGKEKAPKLPASAKKLTGAEITALYDGITVNWHNYVMGGTGTATYNLKKGTQTGTWAVGGKKGKFSGKIEVKGDTFCYFNDKKKQICDSVYTEGSDIYEVNAKGVVESMNQKQ